MKRRDFIRTSATGTALLTASGVFIFQNGTAREKDSAFGIQSARLIPVAFDVDIVIVGGTSAAVAAAVAATRKGASVFLAAQEPYLGEDICGTYRFWANPETALRTELGEKLFGQGLPTPLHVKKTLDNELIDNEIDFLYSSYVTDIVIDATDQPAGVVIASRSGRQAVKAKVIIDATSRGLVAKLAGARFSEYPAGKQEFRYIVLGNQPKEIPGAEVRQMPQQVTFRDSTYQALEYALMLEMADASWKSFCRAEHEARDLVWDPEQVDAGDLLFQVPPDFIIGKERWDKQDADDEQIIPGAFMPKSCERLFVLSGLADINREAARKLLEPGALISVGERLGEVAVEMANKTIPARNYRVKGSDTVNAMSGDVGEILEALRSSNHLGEMEADPSGLPVLGHYDVVVLGGGTAGAPAGVGASRHGASTLVLEYLHGLGGMGTQGMIGRYWDGYRKGYTIEVDEGVRAIGGDSQRQKKRLDEWVFDWKTEYYRREIRKAGGEIWFGTLGIGAWVHEGRVKGVVVATPAGKGIVLAHTVIDSTGSADIAIAAGAGYEYTDGLSVAVQGSGLPFKNPGDHYNNTDWTFIDDSDMLDVWRSFIVAKDKFKDQYDIGKIPQTRERRRMIGDYTVSVLDVFNGRTYPDTFSVHVSSFDTHGFTEDPFFLLKPPAERNVHVTAYVPFRALLPKGIEGIAVTGLGASAHRDAMPVIRMQPCLQNQGFSMGWAAALASEKNRLIREIDLKWLQQKLVEIGNLPEDTMHFKDNYPPAIEAIQEAAKTVVKDLTGLEILLWDTERSLPVIRDFYYLSRNSTDRLVYASILGMLGDDAGWNELMDALNSYDDWDEGWNFTGMGQFGRSLSFLDSLIIAAGRTGKSEVLPAVIRLAYKLTPDSHFSHFRAIAIAIESIGHTKGAEPLFSILQMPGLRGHAMPDIRSARMMTPATRNDVTTRNNSLRELILGRALYKCGDIQGMGNQILNEYSRDLRGHYYRHAKGVLQMFSDQEKKDVEL